LISGRSKLYARFFYALFKYFPGLITTDQKPYTLDMLFLQTAKMNPGLLHYQHYFTREQKSFGLNGSIIFVCLK
jgi:hypothetical protein